MFASFDSVNTPGVKVWDYSRTSSSSALIRICLEDDCAPFQYFLTGANTGSVRVQLPTGSIAGKTVTIRNDKLGASTQSVTVLDPYNTKSTNYLLGASQSVTFICVPHVTGDSGNAGVGVVQWIPLTTGPLNAYAYHGAVLSGSGNTVTGPYAIISGGSSNQALNAYSFVGGGTGNAASNSSATIAGGSGNSASGNISTVAGGTSNNAGGAYSTVCGGDTNIASGTYSAILGGNAGATRSITGFQAIPACNSPIASNTGITQGGVLVLAAATTDATAKVLTSNSSAAATTNTLTLPNNAAYFVKGSVIATVTGGGDTKSWEFTAAIKRGANAASTALVGTPSVTSPYADAGASAWTVALSADTTNGALAVTVTGAAATTIRWVCKLESVEVTY